MTDTGNEGNAAPHRAAVLLLALYALMLVVLSVDVMARVWSWRSRLEPGNLVTLMFFEASRSAVTLAAVTLVLYMLVRRNARAWRPLSLAIAFAAIWHSKAFGFSGFPGALQESMALWLRAKHTPMGILVFVFGSPAWTLWAGTAALVYFSTSYPRQLLSDDVSRQRGTDRTGLLRGSAVAGMDIGQAFRNVCARALQRGWLEPLPLAACTLSWIIVFHLFGSHQLMMVVGAAVLTIAGGIVVTNLRAARMHAESHAVNAMTSWLARSAITSTTFLGASAIASVALRNVAPVVGVVLLGLAPVAAIGCLWCAVVSGGEPQSDRQ